MKKIKELMSRFVEAVMPLDKMRHFFVGTLLALLLTWFEIDPFVVVYICGAVGILKEMSDYYTGGKQEFWDVIYTMASSVILLIILY